MYNINRYIFEFLSLLLIVIGTATQCHAQFTTTLRIPSLKDGDMVYLYNDDDNSLLDSLAVSNEMIVFPSDRFKPGLVTVKVKDKKYGSFILSDADITFDVKVEKIEGGEIITWKSLGGYNDSFNRLSQRLSPIQKELGKASALAIKDSLRNVLRNIIIDNVRKNGGNILGYKSFLMVADGLTPDRIEGLIDSIPSLLRYNRVIRILDQKRSFKATMPGKIFRDFTVAHDDTIHTLSDIVGKGDFVLIDFWDSRFGPCRAEMQYIKEAYETFKDKKFKVLGITVSDKPENSLETAARLDLPWEIWVSGGLEILDTYSFNSIPLLILFGPDGTILERSLLSKAIVPAIEKHLRSAD